MGGCSGSQGRNDAGLDQGGGPREGERTDLRRISEVKPIDLSKGLAVGLRERENSKIMPDPGLQKWGRGHLLDRED